jgi:CheY-like chemotaxis protein
VFKIYLLPTSRHVDAVVQHTDTGTRVGRETILLVEDEAGVRSFARIVLEPHGYRVLEAISSEAALNVVASHVGPLDVVVTDVMLPGMNGGQLARRLLESRPLLHVLFMSGYAEPVAGSGLPPDAELLEKPFIAQALLAPICARSTRLTGRPQRPSVASERVPSPCSRWGIGSMYDLACDFPFPSPKVRSTRCLARSVCQNSS